MNQHLITAGNPISLQSWVWLQHWSEMLFLHWRVDRSQLESRLPAGIEIATCDDDAWVSLVLFRLRVRARRLPFVPWLSSLVEVNLRTYVTCNGKPGIWFLSVHADNRLAISAARMLTPLPYQHAAMRYECVGNQHRFGARNDSGKSIAEMAFRPSGPWAEARQGSLDEWLLERYRLFIKSGDELMQADVSHPKWKTQKVAVAGVANDFGSQIGIELAPTPDLAHFSAGVRARFGPFQRLSLNDSNELPQQYFPRIPPTVERLRPFCQNPQTTLQDV